LKAMETNYNSAGSLTQWMNDALLQAAENGIPKVTIERLRRIGEQIIAEGGWRGDISHVWMEMGFTMADIPGMYP